MPVNPKPSSADTPNQNIYYEDQNFDIDIEKIYSDWIVPIDSIRSFSSIQGSSEMIIKELLSFQNTDVSGISKLVNMENTVQESRCHAFYRMIGFPVVSTTLNQIYNPGFDIIKDENRKIKATDRLTIAKNSIKGFNALSDAREKQSQDNLKTFSIPTSIDAGVLALSSGGTQKLRKFIVPLDKNAEPLDIDIKNQSYDVDSIARVGNNSVPLSEYQDRNGNFPEENGNRVNRLHIIKPFIVDARIELTVSPQSRLMAVPFVPNNDPSFYKVSATESVSPTVLEKIITERSSIISSIPAGTKVSSMEEYIKTVPAIKDSNLLTIVNNQDIFKQDISYKFINSVNTIITMMKKLVSAENIIRTVQDNYYWVPVPSVSGPEGGVEIQDVFLSNIIDTKLQTAADREIVLSSIRLALDGNLNTEAKAPRSIIPTTDFGSSTTSGLGNNDTQNSETLLNKRARVLTKAGDALRTVEIIMGDFSGLGLCDIVAIISALNIMTSKGLLGFLDDDAYARMQKNLKITSPDRSDFNSSITELTGIVKDYYNLMDKIYKDIKERQGIV